jgi:predicted Zn-dependent protease with MMP-like domain
MTEEKYPINLWVNEERLDKLQEAGLADMCEEMMAGLKVIRVYANDAQKDKILDAFPTAKFDSATTKSIELLPREVKDKIFDLIVDKKNIDVIDDFLKSNV